MHSLSRKLLVTALTSRIVTVIISSISHLLIPRHNAGDVFSWIKINSANDEDPTVTDLLVSLILDGLSSWDGQHFLHIANNGYTFENNLAFFPLYPLLVRLLAEIVNWLQVDYRMIRFETSLKISAAIVSTLCFAMATLALFMLSKKVLRHEYLAYKSCLFFCVNPASIFFSAAYSESLYAALSFYAMFKIERGFSFQMAFLLALSTASRFNGIILVGFVAYKCLRIIAREVCIHYKLAEFGKSDISTLIANIIGDAIVPTFFVVLASTFPFVLHQWFAFTQFCSITKNVEPLNVLFADYAKNHSLRLAGISPPSIWCYNTIPLAYQYVQATYWNVGFLRYYRWQNIPRFVLAVPILFLVIHQFIIFYQDNQIYCRSLGLNGLKILNDFTKNGDGRIINDSSLLMKLSTSESIIRRKLPKICFVYLVHALFLAIFSILFIHIEVSTRLILSSSPVPFWLAALLTAPYHRLLGYQPNQKGNKKVFEVETPSNLKSIWIWESVLADEIQSSPSNNFIYPFFFGYALVGTVLFSTFLPWT